MKSIAQLKREIEQAPTAGGKTIIRTIIERQPDLRVKNILAGHAMAFRNFDWWKDCRERGVVFDEAQVEAHVEAHEPEEFRAVAEKVLREGE